MTASRLLLVVAFVAALVACSQAATMEKAKHKHGTTKTHHKLEKRLPGKLLDVGKDVAKELLSDGDKKGQAQPKPAQTASPPPGAPPPPPPPGGGAQGGQGQYGMAHSTSTPTAPVDPFQPAPGQGPHGANQGHHSGAKPGHHGAKPHQGSPPRDPTKDPSGFPVPTANDMANPYSHADPASKLGGGLGQPKGPGMDYAQPSVNYGNSGPSSGGYPPYGRGSNPGYGGGGGGGGGNMGGGGGMGYAQPTVNYGNSGPSSGGYGYATPQTNYGSGSPSSGGYPQGGGMSYAQPSVNYGNSGGSSGSYSTQQPSHSLPHRPPMSQPSKTIEPSDGNPHPDPNSGGNYGNHHLPTGHLPANGGGHAPPPPNSGYPTQPSTGGGGHSLTPHSMHSPSKTIEPSDGMHPSSGVPSSGNIGGHHLPSTTGQPGFPQMGNGAPSKPSSSNPYQPSSGNPYQPSSGNPYQPSSANPSHRVPGTPSGPTQAPSTAQPNPAKPNGAPTSPSPQPDPTKPEARPPTQPPSQPQPSSGGEVGRLAGFTQAHNVKRASPPANTAPLVWSEAVAASAASWAKELKEKKNGYGENLAWASGKQMDPQYVVSSWYNEISDYDYNTGKCTPGKMCGHYTQVIWSKTTEVGCAVETCGNSEIWVCQYNPPGNYIGQKPY